MLDACTDVSEEHSASVFRFKGCKARDWICYTAILLETSSLGHCVMMDAYTDVSEEHSASVFRF
jgi:hypothetical protein